MRFSWVDEWGVFDLVRARKPLVWHSDPDLALLWPACRSIWGNIPKKFSAPSANRFGRIRPKRKSADSQNRPYLPKRWTPFLNFLIIFGQIFFSHIPHMTRRKDFVFSTRVNFARQIRHRKNGTVFPLTKKRIFWIFLKFHTRSS